MAFPPLRVAVIGHVEHATVGRVAALPPPGGIAHLEDPRWVAGGGGAITFQQLARGPRDRRGGAHFFTAIGNDDAARDVERALLATGASIHAARRDAPQTRDLIAVTPDAERTIWVVGEPLHATLDDPLPWEILAQCDAVYFTGQDPRLIEAARAAKLLVVTARRAEALARSGVRPDIVVGSAKDPRERSSRADYPQPPAILVMTEGGAGGYIETASGVTRFRPGPKPERIVGSYGAGDSFAGALTWYAARGLSIVEACERAGRHGAAVLAAIDPIETQLALE